MRRIAQDCEGREIITATSSLSRESLFRTVAEQNADLVWACSSDGLLVYANPAWHTYTGRSLEDLNRDGWDSLVHPEEVERMSREWQEAFSTGAGFTTEFRYRRADGTYRWFRGQRVPVQNEDGTISHWVGQCTDIHDRKEAESRFAAVLESIDDHVATYDRELRFTFVNDAAVRILGHSREELIGRRFDDVFPEAVGNPFHQALLGALADGKHREFLFRYAPHNRWYENRIYPSGSGLTVFSSDVTEVREAEEALGESRAMLQAFMDHIPALAWTNAPDGRVLYANDRLAEAMGCDAAEMIGKLPTEFVDGEDGKVHLRHIQQVAKTGSPIAVVENAKTADGSTRTFLVHKFPIFGNRELLAVGGVGVDITERIQAEHELQASEERYRTLAESVPQLIWSCQPDGSCDYLSDQWVRYTGVPREQHLGFNWIEALHPEDRGRAADAWQYAVGTQSPYEVEFRMRGTDGSYRWFSARGRCVRDREGRTTRWFCSSTDIHDSRMNAAKERAERQRLRLALEVADAGAWEWTAATEETNWSDEMYALHGVSRDEEEPVGRSLLGVLPEDRERVIGAMAVSKSTGAPFDVEFRIDHPSRGRRWLHSRGVAQRDSNGQVRQFIGVTLDITDRKTLQQELVNRVRERTAELEAANRELEGFTYSVSHDLRAPLRSIVAHARMIEEDYGDDLPASAREYLRRQSEAANKLGVLIDELLKLSRLGRQDIRRESLDLSAMVREVFEEVASRYPERTITLDVDEGLVADADPRLLRLAIVNLVENSVKYSPTGGQIEFRSEGPARFFIRDQGMGFNMQYAHKLFLPFERLVTVEQFPGTGIGLANVKRIVERHGGHIWADGEEGKGAVFTFTLPTSDERSDP